MVAVARAAKLAEILGVKELAGAGPPVFGAALAGLRYRRPLEIVPLPEGARHSVVVTGDFVTVGEGTGLVHITPAFGADDYAMGREHGLAMVRAVAGGRTSHGPS